MAELVLGGLEVGVGGGGRPGPGLAERGCSPGDPPRLCVGLSREPPGVMEAGEAAGPRADAAGLLVGVQCDGAWAEAVCGLLAKRATCAVAARPPELGQECPRPPGKHLCLQSPGPGLGRSRGGAPGPGEGLSGVAGGQAPQLSHALGSHGPG